MISFDDKVVLIGRVGCREKELGGPITAIDSSRGRVWVQIQKRYDFRVYCQGSGLGTDPEKV